jgi:hypothetical protein
MVLWPLEATNQEPLRIVPPQQDLLRGKFLAVGIARAKNADVTLAGEKFCEFLRKVAKEALSTESPKRFSPVDKTPRSPA